MIKRLALRCKNWWIKPVYWNALWQRRAQRFDFTGHTLQLERQSIYLPTPESTGSRQGLLAAIVRRLQPEFQ